MAASICTITAVVSWWVKPYLFGVGMVSKVMGIDPDWDKVATTASKGISLAHQRDRQADAKRRT